jgi:hypothetical protein
MLGSAGISNTSWLAVTVENPPHFTFPIGKSSEVRVVVARGRWLSACAGQQ